MPTKQRCPRFLALPFLILPSFLSVTALSASATADDWAMPSGGTQPAPSAQPASAPSPDVYGYPEPMQRQPEAPLAAETRYYYAPPPPQQPADKVVEEEPSPPFFDLTAGTVAPLSIGGQANLELPARILLQLDVGWMPPGYASAINGMVESFGGYDSAIGSLINGALDDAVVVRASAGWRPFPKHGFEIYAGYTHVSLGGSVAASDVAEVVGGDFEEIAAAAALGDIEVSSKLHNFHVALGWRWVVWDHLVIRALVGYTQTLGSSSSVAIEGHPDIEAMANPIVDEELDVIYTDYVKLPMLGLNAGYRF
jgi:hypothetical protein